MQRKARKKIFLGFLVLFAISAPFGGLQIILFSIICTAGIALVIWIPIAFLLGTMTFKLIDLFGGKKEVIPEVEGLRSKQQRALTNYIYKAKKDGFSDEKITSFLKDQGWTEDEIKEAFNSSQKDNP